jgi:uncharacterized protein (TIGR03083 family)
MSAFETALATGPGAAPVASCPGWDLRELGIHLGQVHRWAACAVRTGERPPGSIFAERPADDEPVADWYRAGADALLAALDDNDPASPTWHLWNAPMVASLWHRRQPHETLVHRWDAQAAIGTPDPMDPTLASDGVDEFFDIMLGRKLGRNPPPLPTQTLHLHCTDVEGEWFVWADGETFHMTREHKKGDAAMRGRAEDLLLVLWHRGALDLVDVAGDAAAAQAWLDLGSV